MRIRDKLIAKCKSCGKETFKTGGLYDRCILHNPHCENKESLEIYDKGAVMGISKDKTVKELGHIFKDD